MCVYNLSVSLIFVLLSSYAYCADILGVFSFPSISHQRVFQQIYKTLAQRGHKVVVITPDPLNDPSLKNLTEIDVSSSYKNVLECPLQATMDNRIDFIQQFNNVIDTTFKVVEEQLSQEQCRKFLENKNQNFDLIMVENFYPLLHPFGYKYNAPVISISTFPLLLHSRLAVGNPGHPVLYPNLFLTYTKDLGFFERLHSTFHSVFYIYNYYYRVLPKAQETAERIFGDIPNIDELERNASLVISVQNSILNQVIPTVPASVHISSVHIEEAKELPEDLKKILDEAREGLIYFSLGSNVKSVNIQNRLKQVIISALSELPYKVLWKWEADHMPGKPDNVIIRKWLPQQDLLAHPNVKAFVTQGGLQSAEEAIARGVPMIGLPFFGDQPMNIVKLAEAGVAIHLDKDTVTKDELKNAIIEVVENVEYRERVLEIRDLLYDQPMKSIDKAVWWIEYVIRHKGARHLRSPSLDLPWYQYFLLDVIGATLAVIILVLFVLYKSVCLIIRSVFSRKKVKTS